MTYDDWILSVPEAIQRDSLWKAEVYRLSLFLSDLSWEDASRLLKDRRTLAISDQLYRATANISSNIAEGYSRGTGKDRARFYEYALGSAREARDWYYKGRHVLSAEVMAHRLDLLTQIIKLTLSMTGKERLINRRIVEA